MTTAGATWQLTGVQFEVGDVATPFEHRSFGDELARCQRYFISMDMVENSGNDRFYGNRYSVSNGFVFLDFPVTMRTLPTITITDSVTSTGLDVASYNAQERAAIYMASTAPYVTFPKADAEL